MTNSIRNPEGLFKLHKACVHGSSYSKKLKIFVSLLALLTSINVLAATRVTPVNETIQVSDNGCDVTVFQTQLSALKNGAIEEICIIEGTSSGSSKLTSEKAIETNAHEACGCGTDKAYIMSRSKPNKSSTHVVMVAFRYVNELAASIQTTDPYEAMKMKHSSYKKPSNSKPANTRRVFIDDYELLPHTVIKKQQRQTLWLRSNVRSD